LAGTMMYSQKTKITARSKSIGSNLTSRFYQHWAKVLKITFKECHRHFNS
jgi:hypothetical protein